MKRGAGSGSFGAHLKGLREAAGFTQEELATIAGLSVHAVSALERGERRRPQFHTLRASRRQRWFTQSVDAFRALDVPCGVGNGLSGMAWVALTRADLDGADRLLDEAAPWLARAYETGRSASISGLLEQIDAALP